MTSAPVAVAVRAVPAPPHIDGRMDDDAWDNAAVYSGFVQQNPNEGEPGTEHTEFRVVYTDAAIYVCVRAQDSRASEITGQLTRRDVSSPSDWIAIGFDSYYDRRTAFAFFVNAAGVKRDVYYFDDNNSDASWDAVWDVATSTDEEGWTAEFRIPFSQLRFPDAEEHRFGLQVYRGINRLNEDQFWRLPPKDQSGFVSLFGDLVGIEGVSPPRRVEVMPYVAGASGWYPEEAGNPFASGSDQKARVGADFNIGVTSNLSLSATVNPDFGQVEADPAVVNLSAFETFFPEKRPFFNEGLDIFRFPILLGDGDNANEQLFYTRRVGRAPQGDPDPRGGYAETITETTILGAAKLSGKTPDGWTVGVLTALTDEEKADIVDGTGARFNEVVEPRSGYFVGRLARDYRNGLTQVGLFSTAVLRDLPDNLDYLRSSAYSLGANLSHRFANDTYSIRGWIVGSHVLGSAEAIDETQRSSARYYQRPDNEHVSYDPTRTSLSGFAAQLTAGKHAGGLVRFSTGFDTRSPGFEVNDAGFQREADRTIQYVWVGLRWLQPGKVFRELGLNFNQYSTWSYGWERLGLGGNVNAWFTFLNYWGGNVGIEHGFGGLSTGALRGGPAFAYPSRSFGWAGFFSDSRKQFRGGLFTSFSPRDVTGSWLYSVSPNVSWRPAANLDFTLGPSVFRQFDSWQYLDRVDALGSEHFMFGELKQTTVSMTFRGNLTFSPTMSLEVYAQPFVSSGDFQNFRQVTDPRADRFEDRFEDFEDDQVLDTDGDISIDLNRDGMGDVDLGNPDFTVLAFRSNVVLRWEYVLGSTIYFVWQHGRWDESDDGRFRPGHSVGELWSADQENRLVLKINYWLSL